MPRRFLADPFPVPEAPERWAAGLASRDEGGGDPWGLDPGGVFLLRLAVSLPSRFGRLLRTPVAAGVAATPCGRAAWGRSGRGALVDEAGVGDTAG